MLLFLLVAKYKKREYTIQKVKRKGEYMKIKEILKVTKGQLICGNEEVECIDFSKDTRTIKKGDTYIGIKGGNFDGNKFWEEALNKGASTVIINNAEISEEQKTIYARKNIIIVSDSLEALYDIAEYKRSLYNIPVIAITGSVRKNKYKRHNCKRSI